MSDVINVYCDESAHLPNDHQAVMLLGAVWCPQDKLKEINRDLREIKTRHGLPPHFEVKWSKVSPGQASLYRAVADYFFDTDDLHFRALVVPDKARLLNSATGEDFDARYYGLYFEMLKVLFSPKSKYEIYVDIKDSRSAERLRHLHEALCNDMYDFDREIIVRLQTVRSHDVELIPMADLLMGAVGYANRALRTNAAKAALMEQVQGRSGHSLTQNTLVRDEKISLSFQKAGMAAQ